MKHYPDVNPNPDFPKIEAQVLARWQESGLFQKSIDNRPAQKPSPTGRGLGEDPHPNLPASACASARQVPGSAKLEERRRLPGGEGTNNEFIFYDGPPFANGLPHYGHLLTGYVKDLYARYQTMRGRRVERRFGWDCHGLPAEMGSEKELGISGRAAIQNFGIDKFNEHCRTSVMKYTREWEDYVTRQARWVDFKNDYKTMDINFMESVLWAFKQLYDKGLVYEAHRVMPYSWAAETPLSNFETKLDNSYREREDKAITVAFELNTPPHGAPKAEKYYVLAWTTTPWTLPSNLALAVGDKVEYCYQLEKNICYLHSKSSADKLLPVLGTPDENGVRTLKLGHNIFEAKFNELIGLSYHPLFPYFASHKHAFKILDGSSFVTDGDGTGIVHMAPGFGEDDQKCCEANGIELVVPVDGQGKYTDEIFDIPFPRHPRERGDLEPQSKSPEIPAQGGDDMLRLKGLNVIAEPGGSKFGLANDRIIDYLKASGQLIKQEQIKHNYPHCWRTDQPLIYRAMPSWYVEVTKFRDRAVEINKTINWIPEHIRDGQMGHMLATAPDWSISRNRFWGTPIPVWRAKSGKIIVIGSIAELEKLSGKKVTDLHRPYIDEITIEKDGETYTRVEDVFDCWFESGSMPFAQVHYPFENKEWFEAHFPADFITEYVGQTRGWFNTLIMLSTALFDKAPFKNCICHGVVLDSETGLKYSKRLKNYKDPMEVMDKFGADALRWLMISSPVMRGQDLAVDPEGKFIRDVVRLAIKPIWNAYNFFTLYANADGVKAAPVIPGAVEGSKDSSTALRSGRNDNVMDRYILAKCAQAVETIEKSLDAYDTPAACDAVMQLFEVLNNWYIRRNKERFWAEEKSQDKQAAYDTLYTVLTTMCRAAAPLLPLTLDEIYKGLTGDNTLSLRERVALKAPGEGEEYASKKLIENARALRKNSTDVEGILWNILRNRQIENKKFRRQYPIGNHVLDFYCEEEKLAIELDGGQHAGQQTYDEKRTKFLEEKGIRVIRFWNNEVLENIEGVVEIILQNIQPSPGATRHPLPKGEGISVHLADFPDVSAWGINEYLLKAVDTTRDICNAALSIRNSKNLRVRLPLKSMKIVSSVIEEQTLAFAGFSETIRSEINVKNIDWDLKITDYATLKLSINNPVLGKRLPALMKQILPASKKGEWKQVDGTVEICGEKLLPGEYMLQLEPKPEYKDRAQALSTNDALVILDTTVTPELEAEGIARDVVRMIQQARKDAGLNVSDRISLFINASVPILEAVSKHKSYIEEQTLSTSLATGQPGKPADFVTEKELDEHKVTIGITKAA